MNIIETINELLSENVSSKETKKEALNRQYNLSDKEHHHMTVVHYHNPETKQTGISSYHYHFKEPNSPNTATSHMRTHVFDDKGNHVSSTHTSPKSGTREEWYNAQEPFRRGGWKHKKVECFVHAEIAPHIKNKTVHKLFD